MEQSFVLATSALFSRKLYLIFLLVFICQQVLVNDRYQCHRVEVGLNINQFTEFNCYLNVFGI